MAESMAPSVARVGVHGEPWLNIHQRMASAPRVSRMLQGSMVLPSDLDILRPSGSTRWPRQTTWRYGLSPNTRVLMARSE